MQMDTNELPKQENKISAPEFNEPQPSDDDDFPDEQEIFQANSLRKLQNTLGGPVSSKEHSFSSKSLYVSIETT